MKGHSSQTFSYIFLLTEISCIFILGEGLICRMSAILSFFKFSKYFEFTFVQLVKEINSILLNNVDFDKKVVGAELIRTSHYDLMGTKFSYCTMKNSINFCKIPYKQGYYKYPKLQELYFCLFGMHFEGEHNAANDVEATQKCFWAMRERGLI